jgi:hypothetical protein
MATTNIDAIFNKIEQDFIKISKEAAKKAATKAQKDIKEKADQFIGEYYDYTPKRYKKNRKHALYDLVEKVYEESESSSGVTIEFGIKYDHSKIEGLHKSNSRYRQSGSEWIPRLSADFNFDSGDNGIPSAEWITNKFLEGIHPSGLIGNDGGHKDKKSPDKKMQEFFNTELQQKVNRYMTEELLSAVKKYF